MNPLNPVTLIPLLLALCCTACRKGDDLPVGIEGLTFDNYPRVDGSTSTEPLNIIIACKLLGYPCEWRPFMVGNRTWRVMTNPEDVPENFYDRIKCSQTHPAILNLIDRQTDLIISARKASADEQAYARKANVSLLETPIAWDALDFLLHANNPVTSLTVRQIQDIYTGTLTNWREANGAVETIKPLIRNADSGSQEMMKEIVMHNAGMSEWEAIYAEEDVVMSMMAAYAYLGQYPNAICFTPHYYKEYIVRDTGAAGYVKTVAVDGVLPDKTSIGNRTYPFVAPVYVCLRSDTDRDSPTYKLYEWLQCPEGKRIIAASGYIPN